MKYEKCPKHRKHNIAVNLLKHAIDQYSNQNMSTEHDNNLIKMKRLLQSEQIKATPVEDFEHILGKIPPKTNDFPLLKKSSNPPL